MLLFSSSSGAAFARSLSSTSSSSAIPLLLLGGLLLIAGCDSSVDLQQNNAEPTTRTVPADSSGLALAPMPTGATLLAPGEPAPKSDADASAHGCYLASRPYSEEVAFHSRYLHFPEEVIEEADDATRRVAWSIKAKGETASDFTGVRYMHCIIPDADAAEQLAHEQVLDEGLEAAAYQAVDDADGAVSKSSCQMVTISELLYCAGPSADEPHTCTYAEYDMIVCGSGGSGGSNGGSNDFPEGGSGDGSAGGGDCTEQVLDPPPGSSCEPTDPCESDNPPAHCEEDEEDPCVPSLSDLESVFSNTSSGKLEEIKDAIEEHGPNFSLTESNEINHFLSQTAHESYRFTKTEEQLSYSAERLKEVFWAFNDENPNKKDAEEYAGNPEKLANFVYGDREDLGNRGVETGDGWKYRGRGFIQLTGRANYQSFDDLYQGEFDEDIDLLESPGQLSSNTELATIASLWFFEENVLEPLDTLNVESVTEAINGGLNGLEDREDLYEQVNEEIDC